MNTTTTTFDTLKLSDKFIAAGIDEKHARVFAETFGELANDQLVTKEYLDFKLKNEFEKLELRMTIKTAVIVAAVVGFFRIMEAFF